MHQDDLQNCRVQTQEVNSVHVGYEMLNQLTQPSCDSSQHALLSQATVMLKSLMYLAQHCDKPHRFEGYMDAMLTRVALMKNGVGCIIALLVTGTELIIDDHAESAIHTVHNLILRWLRSKSFEPTAIPLPILTQACEYHEEFLTLYLEVLTNWTNQMQRSYDGKPALCTWINKGGKKGSWEDLCKHYKSLMRTVAHTRHRVTKVLEDRGKEDYFNIYKDIMKEIMRKS